MVGGAHDALIFHLLYQTRGLVVADRQLALDVGRRTLAVLGHDRDSRVIKRVLTIGIATEAQDLVDAGLGLGLLLLVGLELKKIRVRYSLCSKIIKKNYLVCKIASQLELLTLFEMEYTQWNLITYSTV